MPRALTLSPDVDREAVGVALEPTWLPKTDGKRLADFIASLAKVKEGGGVWIFAGTLNPNFYGDPDLLKALSTAIDDRHAVVDVIAGPVLVTDKHGSNPMYDLGRLGKLRLRHREMNLAPFHFRVVQTPTEYLLAVESAHNDAGEHGRNCAQFDEHEPKEVQAFARRELTFFASLDPQVTTATRAHRLPLLLSQKETDEMRKKADALHLDWERLDPVALRTLHPRSRR